MVVDTPINMRKIESIIKMLDTKRRASWPRSVIRCENVSSKHIVSELAAILPVLGFPVTVDKVVSEPGAIHLAQIERLQVIVASAANQEALDEVVKWVSILDRSDVGNQEQVFVYKVINSKAESLLQVLATIFKVDGVAVSQDGVDGASSSSTISDQGGTAASVTSRTKSSTTVVKSGNSASAKGNGPATVFEVPVKIFADGANNRIIARTTPRTYAMIKALLKRLDTIPAQVLLQVLIAEIRLGENTEFGVEFAGITNNGNKRGGFGTNYDGLIPQMPSNNAEHGFKYLIRNGADKYAYIRGLAGTGNFKILASPQLAAVSGTAATLDVGQEIPIITRTLSDTTTTNTLSTSNEVEYKKTGILLKIIPKVTKGGLITLDLNQTVSARGEDVSAGGTSYPSFINRQVVTALSLRDGDTLVVGGIIQEIDRSQNDSLPLIAKVPVLATLLGYTTKQVERTELLIMITASILKEKSDLQKLVSRYKQSIALIKKFNESVKKKKKKDAEKEKQ
jgi:type II secretion system protein D